MTWNAAATTLRCGAGAAVRVRPRPFGSRATWLASVIRWYNDGDNGRFNVNADNDPDNRKRGSAALPGLNSDIGALAANSSGCPGRPSVAIMSSHALLF